MNCRIILLLVSFLFSFNLCCFSQQTEKLSVYFKFDKYDLEDNAKTQIDSLLNKHSIKHISLKGHCDSLGDHIYNDALSLMRVMQVKNYLISKNINENNIEIKALGKRA